MKFIIAACMLCLLLFACGEDQPMPTEFREGHDINQGINATQEDVGPPATDRQNGTGPQQQ
jgi:hypothetical protein